eukprot:Skav210551  [mRNA]  locus=scaffold4856:56703:59461:- [translate_table: standard]
MASADPHELRGFVPLQLLASTYRLSAVVQHLGATPFAGHYVALLGGRYCWNHVSSRWYCFDDSRVRCVEPEVVAKEALNDGAYVPWPRVVLFFELDVLVSVLDPCTGRGAKLPQELPVALLGKGW